MQNITDKMQTSKEQLSTHLSINDGYVVALVSLIVFFVYVMTLAPGLTWEHWGADGAEFIVAIVRGTLPHPPGFPLYLFLARLMTLIPLGDVSMRMNLFSAIMAVGAVCFAALSLRLQGSTLWSMVSASLCLGFAPLFWSQAVITEVYTTAAFFVSLTYYISQREDIPLTSTLLPGITWGMAVGVHPITVFSVLLFWKKRKLTWTGIIAGAVLSFILYLSLFFLGNGLQKWADLTSVRGWYTYVSANLYWGYAFSLPVADIIRRILSLATIFSRQFTPIGILLIVFGYGEMRQESKKTAIGLLFIAFIISVYIVTYNSIDSFVYLVPFLPLVSVILGKGMDKVLAKGIPGFLMLIVPIILLGMNWHNISLRSDFSVHMWIDSTLEQIPEGAVILTSEDHHSFSLWYAQEVKGEREDLLVVDTRLWEFDPYRRYITQDIGWVPESLYDLRESQVLCTVSNKGVVCD